MRKIALACILCFVLATPCYSDDQPSVHGNYINKQDNKEYLTLYPDRTFHLKQRTKPADISKPFMELSGKYEIQGEDITLKLSDGGEASGKLKDNTFEDSDGGSWVKEGTERFKLERPKRMKW